MEDAEQRKLIEQAAAEQGYTIAEFYDHAENGLTGKIGRFEVVSNLDEDYGFYDGDEGVLEASVVGAAIYGNVRVAFSFISDGADVGNEVHSFEVLEPLSE